MHYPKSVIDPPLTVTLIDADGNRRQFASLTALADASRYDRLFLAGLSLTRDFSCDRQVLWREDGVRLTRADVDAVLPARRVPTWYERHTQAPEDRRRAPVPGTGIRRRWWRRTHRAPRTLRTLREQCWKGEEEDTPPVRRHPGPIVTRYDDIPRSTNGCANWKRYRRQQWKE